MAAWQGFGAAHARQARVIERRPDKVTGRRTEASKKQVD